MKWFSSIFAIYILFLVMQPCVDYFCTAGVPAIDNVQTEAPDDCDGDHCDDACTPFCFCSCCSVPAAISDEVYKGEPGQVVVSFIPGPVISYRSTDFHNFWQPPKLA